LGEVAGDIFVIVLFVQTLDVILAFQ